MNTTAFDEQLRRVMAEHADSIEPRLSAAAIRPIRRYRLATLPVALGVAAGVLVGAGSALAAPAVFDHDAPQPALDNHGQPAPGISSDGHVITERACPAGWTSSRSGSPIDWTRTDLPLFKLSDGNCVYPS